MTSKQETLESALIATLTAIERLKDYHRTLPVEESLDHEYNEDDHTVVCPFEPSHDFSAMPDNGKCFCKCCRREVRIKTVPMPEPEPIKVHPEEVANEK